MAMLFPKVYYYKINLKKKEKVAPKRKKTKIN